ncbi:MAG: hypothetical protein ABI892_07975 [Flavobacterium sp.]
MALQTLNTIKQWFRTGLKPTQAQFWDTWDSFRHKYEKLPVKDIEGLDDVLLSKADKTVLDNHIADKNAHAPQINTDWNSKSGFSQLLNKPEFKTINGEAIIGTSDITVDIAPQNLQQTLENGANATFEGTAFIKLLDGEPFQKVVSWDFLNDSQEAHFYSNLDTFNNTVKNGSRNTSIVQKSNELIFTKTHNTEDGTFQNTFDLGTPTSSSRFTLPSKEEDGNYTIATLDDIVGKNGLTLQKVLENGSEGIIPNGVKVGHNAINNSTYSTINLKEGGGIDLYTNGTLNTAAKDFYINSRNGGGFIKSGEPSQSQPLTINSENVGIKLDGGAGGILINGQGKEVKLSGADYGDGGIQILSRLGVGRVKNITGSDIEISSESGLKLNSSKKTSLALNNGADAIIEMDSETGVATMNIRSMGKMNIISPNDLLKVTVGTQEGQGITVNNKNIVRTVNGVEADIVGNVIVSDDTKQIKDNQITISGNATINADWNGQTILFTESGTITVPETLPAEFSFNAITLQAVTINWQINSPFTWLFGTPGTTSEKTYLNFTRVGTSNNIILSV